MRNDIDIPLCTLVQHWGRVVESDGLLLGYAPVDYKADFDIVLKAVTQNGMALQFASDDLRANSQIGLAAVSQCPDAHEFVL